MMFIDQFLFAWYDDRHNIYSPHLITSLGDSELESQAQWCRKQKLLHKVLFFLISLD